jgi:type IV pilus assembly protein PilY1
MPTQIRYQVTPMMALSMNASKKWKLTTLLLSALAGLPVYADDTEVFFFNPPNSNGRPNILFILDTGETMNQPVSTANPFDKGKDYLAETGLTSACPTDRYYYTRGDQEPPLTCSGVASIPITNWKCNAYTSALANAGEVKGINVGFYDSRAGNRQWRDLINPTLTYPGNTYSVECALDAGVHGDGVNTTNLWATNNTNSGWDNRKNQAINWATSGITTQYRFYSAQGVAYNKWLKDNSQQNLTRLDAVKLALMRVIETSPGVNIGLMRFDNNGNATRGGMVVHEFAPTETAADSFRNTLFARTVCASNTDPLCIQIMRPFGRKPIGETMYEAYQYYEGGAIDFGLNSRVRTANPFPSVPGSWYDGSDTPSPDLAPSPGTAYNSPVEEQVCGGRNYIVLLTDGFTEQDRSADTGKIEKLWAGSIPDPPLSSRGTCDDKVYVNGDPAKGQATRIVMRGGREVEELATEDLQGMDGSPPGEAQGSFCVDDIAEFMYQYGVNGGRNKISTYTVGFQLPENTYGESARQLLQETALRGGGDYYEATSPGDLDTQFNDLIRKVLIDNSSFTSPSVTVNAFNRTQNLNDLYISVFRPSLGYRWPGNLKRYVLKPSPGANDDIRDRDAEAAVGSDGFFKTDSRSFWPDFDLPNSGEDGADARYGGAAGQMDDPGNRKIFTNLAESGNLSTELSELATPANASLANQLLFGNATYTPTGCNLNADQLIKWAYGYPVTTDPSTSPCTITVNMSGARKSMGDPLHSRPVALTYGGPPASPDVTVYLTTNDGFLHAIDADDGSELWSFVPQQLLIRLNDLYKDEDTTSRKYGLDSPIRALRFDKNQNGTIEPSDGDRVLLFFGMRRGGFHYFALDVTYRNAPKLLWRIGRDDANISVGSPKHLPGVGETWSVPALTRVNIDRDWGSTEPQATYRWALVFGGGYNTNHDQAQLKTTGDATGNRIFMVDAFTGELIWRAAPPSDSIGGDKLTLSKMTYAVASDVRVIDLTGDGYADRMYASDLGGRVWRFDIYSGQTPDTLITGGVFASLGNADNASPGLPLADTRRFFNAPDPALITYANSTFINIAIGSGHREMPVTDISAFEVHNRFYGLRDYRPFVRLTQAQYDDWESNNLIRDLSTDLSCGSVTGTTTTLSGLLNVSACAFPIIPPGSPGWKLDMKAGGSWSDGEKVLAESVTFQGIVYFPSFSPTQPQPLQLSERCPAGEPDDDNDGVCNVNDACPSSNPTDIVSRTGCILECSPGGGLNRLYRISAANAAPKLLWDDPTNTEIGVVDRFDTLAQGGIAPPAVFIFPQSEGADRTNPPPLCLVGLAECGEGIPGRPVRTFWRQRGAD